MSQYFKPFLYYNGEKENPYDATSQNPQFMFWDYENHFEVMFGMGDFSLEVWGHIAKDDQGELQQVLSADPVDKEELFKMFLYHILMEHLPDKAQEPPTDRFLKLYADNRVF